MDGRGVEEAELHIGSFRVQQDGTARRVQQRRQPALSQANASLPLKQRYTSYHRDTLPADANSFSSSEDASVCGSDCSLDSAMQDYLDNISQDGLCVLAYSYFYDRIIALESAACPHW